MRKVLVCLCLMSGTVWAASPYKRSLTVKKDKYVTDGVFTGGSATGGTSLLGMRRTYSDKAKLERIVIDVGDKEANPNPSEMGYFQVAMDAKTNRVTLDLAELMLSRISEAQVQQMFKKSPFVSSAELTLDPEDKAGTLVLNLKKPMTLEVFQLMKKKNKPARIVIDLKPRTTRSI